MVFLCFRLNGDFLTDFSLGLVVWRGRIGFGPDGSALRLSISFLRHALGAVRLVSSLFGVLQFLHSLLHFGMGGFFGLRLEDGLWRGGQLGRLFLPFEVYILVD